MKCSCLTLKPLTTYSWFLTLRFPPVPAVWICEPRSGAAGDPQLWPGGVGRHQVSDWVPELGLGARGACGGGRRSPGGPRRCRLLLALSFASCSGAGAYFGVASSCRSRLQLRSHAPERDLERRGGPGGAELGGREPGKGPLGSLWPPDPAGAWERAASARQLPGFSRPAAPTQRRARGTTKASATFKLLEALETNGRPCLV